MGTLGNRAFFRLHIIGDNRQKIVDMEINDKKATNLVENKTLISSKDLFFVSGTNL